MNKIICRLLDVKHKKYVSHHDYGLTSGMNPLVSFGYISDNYIQYAGEGINDLHDLILEYYSGSYGDEDILAEPECFDSCLGLDFKLEYGFINDGVKYYDGNIYRVPCPSGHEYYDEVLKYDANKLQWSLGGSVESIFFDLKISDLIGNINENPELLEVDNE